ncbi:MAG: hypothetical protein M5U28_34710 [Sandaracinaceae bacterium]|nr:hypothetical protein [Sandaracinaceae bacterium]
MMTPVYFPQLPLLYGKSNWQSSKTLGYEIDRSKFFGRSFYGEGESFGAIENSVGFNPLIPSPGIPLASHIYGDHYNITQNGWHHHPRTGGDRHPH